MYTFYNALKIVNERVSTLTVWPSCFLLRPLIPFRPRIASHRVCTGAGHGRGHERVRVETIHARRSERGGGRHNRQSVVTFFLFRIVYQASVDPMYSARLIPILD